MHHEGQESSSRKLVWVEDQKIAGWGSECAWVFHPSNLPISNTLDDLTAYAQRQLDNEFASHDCAEHPRDKRATTWFNAAK